MSDAEHPKSNSDIDDLPFPEWLGVVVRVAISAHLATCKPKQAQAFLHEMARILSSEEAVADLMPERPARHHAALARERRRAMAWFRQNMPSFLARMDRSRPT
jgi:hypothetical protein